jgi:hypothetical protein
VTVLMYGNPPFSEMLVDAPKYANILGSGGSQGNATFSAVAV